MNKLIFIIFICLLIYLVSNNNKHENFSNNNTVIINKPVINDNTITCNINFRGKIITIKNEYYGYTNLYDGIEGFVTLFIPHILLSNDNLITKMPICREYYKNLLNVKKFFENKLNKKLNLNIDTKFYDREYVQKKGISTFTGGVDSFYTLLKENNNIDTVFYCINYDIKENQKQLLDKQIDTIYKVAEKLNKKVIICKTNQRQALYAINYETNGYERWGYLIHGVCIFSNVYNLSNEYSNFYFPSAGVEVNTVWGSSIYLDKYYSSSFLKVINLDDINRLNKLKYIINKNKNLVFEHLKVCWMNPNQDYNCSKCEKCLRTILAIGLINKHNLGQLKTFNININDFDKQLNSYLTKKFTKDSDIDFQNQIIEFKNNK